MAKSEIIKDIVKKNITLEDALLRLKIITSSLQNEDLNRWIDSELSGYSSEVDLPEYRKKVGYVIRYSGINGSFQVNNQVLPVTLVSSITSLLIQNLIGLFLKSKGKVKIYVKTVYNKTTQKSWGFQNSINGMIFDIPLWIEIHNTKAKKEVVRDLSLNLYYQGQFVEKMIQVTHSMKGNEKIHYGNNSCATVGLFLINYYERKYKKQVKQIAEINDDDLPF